MYYFVPDKFFPISSMLTPLPLQQQQKKKSFFVPVCGCVRWQPVRPRNPRTAQKFRINFLHCREWDEKNKKMEKEKYLKSKQRLAVYNIIPSERRPMNFCIFNISKNKLVNSWSKIFGRMSRHSGGFSSPLGAYLR